MNHEVYRNIINFIANATEEDYKSVVLYMAKNEPMVSPFYQALKDLGFTSEKLPEDHALDEQVRLIYEQEGHVNAVKFYREKTGCSLEEAVEHLKSLGLWGLWEG